MTDITSATGTPLAWTEDSPFGTIRASGATSQAPANPFRFTGEYRDSATGLDHLRARAYDPTTGRFTTTDPLSPAVGDPYVGAYVYVRNNPVRYTDPSGRCQVVIVLSMLGGLAGSVVPGPGTLAGAAGAASVGAAFCFAEVAAEALVISNAVRDQRLGEARGGPTPRIEVPFSPTYIGPYINSQTGEPQPSWRCISTRCRAAVAAPAAAVLAGIIAGNTEAAGLGRAQK